MSAWIVAGLLGLGSVSEVAVTEPEPEPVADEAEATDEAESSEVEAIDEPMDEAEAGDAVESSEAEAIDEPSGDAEASSDPPSEAAANQPASSEATTTPPSPTPSEPAPEIRLDQGLGGYHRPGEILEREPPDGHRNVVLGSILVPLGTIATLSSAVGIWLTVPEHCTERLAGAGITIEDSSKCSGVFAFNVARTTYGALMLASGAVILSIGLVQRQRYRAWRLEHGMRARLTPTLGPMRGGAGAGLRLRF